MVAVAVKPIKVVTPKISELLKYQELTDTEWAWLVDAYQGVTGAMVFADDTVNGVWRQRQACGSLGEALRFVGDSIGEALLTADFSVGSLCESFFNSLLIHGDGESRPRSLLWEVEAVAGDRKVKLRFSIISNPA